MCSLYNSFYTSVGWALANLATLFKHEACSRLSAVMRIVNQKKLNVCAYEQKKC